MRFSSPAVTILACCAKFVLAVQHAWAESQAQEQGVVDLGRSLVPACNLTDFQGKSVDISCGISGNTTPSLVCNSTTDAPGTLNTDSMVGSCASFSAPATREGAQVVAGLDGGTACKNDGGCTFNHCIRSDLFCSGVSVLANKTQVQSVVNYTKEGTFTVSIQTAAFTATQSSTNATVAFEVQASFGACGARRLSELMSIGSTVSICIHDVNNATGLTINTVTAEPGGQTLVDAAGVPNFVTDITDQGLAGVTLETLMIPAYYDSQTNPGSPGSITIAGKAQRVNARRQLAPADGNNEAPESTPFALTITLSPDDPLPEVAETSDPGENAGSGRGPLGFGAFLGFVSMLAEMIPCAALY